MSEEIIYAASETLARIWTAWGRPFTIHEVAASVERLRQESTPSEMVATCAIMEAQLLGTVCSLVTLEDGSLVRGVWS